ncbi:hypothetical protein KP003_17200 [Geomonas nitrogeniifigens]|uniref:hypothetical protein n=1 Tax=Geomonas diazotrophica TaxID=2843197 RepID=UPI001C2C8C6A|nr:hypothetical protein [Geomonas nitrogeniifigens]QXE86078.1 hypothetical protein KP003_17200 [Geomonas nitrogeniifigens]
MNVKKPTAYEALIVHLASKLEERTFFVAAVTGFAGGIGFGSWGYSAGGVRGAIAFTIMGAVFGGMVGSEISKTLITAIGTATKAIILLTIIALSLVVGSVLKSLPVGLLLLVGIYVYLYYLKWAESQ